MSFEAHPLVVINRRVSATASALARLFPFPDRVAISARSSLVIHSVDVAITALDLDGALVVNEASTCVLWRYDCRVAA